MNTKLLRRSSAAAAVLALSLSLAACGEEDEPTNDAGSGTDTTSETSEAPMDEPSTPIGAARSSVSRNPRRT